MEHAPPWQISSPRLRCLPAGQLAGSIAAHVSLQHSEASQLPPLHLWSVGRPSPWSRAFCPAGQALVAPTTPWSRQPDAQHSTWQQSACSHTPPEHMWPSSMPRALLEAGHLLVPLASPELRQPDAQHCALQQSFAKHEPLLQE